MGYSYQNSTYNELLALIPDPAVREAFDEWKERGKDKLVPYKVSLDGDILKAYGDLDFVDGQKSIQYETTYGDILTLRGKRRPRTINLNFIIEYDFVNDNSTLMKEQVNKLKQIKKDRTAVLFSISEIDVEYYVTIETLRIVYRGVRDVYIQAELMEIYEYEINN